MTLEERQAAMRLRLAKPVKVAPVPRKVSYFALHARVRIARGRPRLCEDCGSTTAKAYDWASVSGKYEDISDYRRLCRACHIRKDGTFTNLRQYRRALGA